jgi:DNA primase
MPAIDFRELRALVSMQEVLNLLGFVPLSSSGVQVRGRCPLHSTSEGGNSRSFSAHLTGNKYQCFKCGAAGNHLDLWAKATKQTVYAAALDLCERLGRDIPWLSTATEKRNP